MVEWKKLGEVCDILDSQRKPVAKEERSQGIYPYYGANGIQDYVSSYIFDGTFLLMGEDGSVINKDKSPVLHWTEGRIWVNNHAHILKENERALLRYLYYSLQCTDVSDIVRGVPPKINQANMRNIPIPIPSLSEQQRIVSILDTFTSSISNLKQQIEERRKQYEYERDLLLDLEGKEGVEMKKLGEVFSFKNGLNKGKEFFGKGKPIIMFTNVFNSRFITKAMIKSRVDISEQELERINAQIGDVFFTRTSETKEDVGYASVLVEDMEECTFAGFLIRARPITHKMLPQYCKYCFSTPKVRNAIVSKSSFTTRASLTGSGLGEVIIPLPPLSTQSRIVSILDTFEQSISNLEEQLAMREKQYEYYRNQLLTFEGEEERGKT